MPGLAAVNEKESTMSTPTRMVMLSVGIGDYAHPGVNDLALTRADARAMAQAAMQLGSGDTLVRLLLDGQATKAGMKAGIDWLASAVGADDVALFYYSGHGARYTDQDSDEPDAYDEFLCPYDTGVNGGVETFIRDDEMREWLEAITAQTSNLVVILDSCHSGSAILLGEATSKELSRELVQEMLTDYKRPAKEAGIVPGEGPLDGHMLLAAAEAHQSSYELQGMSNGLFTTYVLEGLDDASIGTFYDLFDYAAGKVNADAAQYNLQQTPHRIERAEGDLAYR
jgi:uncharacterized caspase-like protein